MERSFCDEDGRGIPRRRPRELKLQLTPHFALQLQEIYGSVGYNIDSALLLEEDLAISVDHSLGASIHNAWKRGYWQTTRADYAANRKKIEAIASGALEDGKGIPLDIIKNGLKLPLGERFATQLMESFGSEGCHHEIESDLIVSVGVDLLQELHSALGQNFMQNVGNEGLFDMFKIPVTQAECQAADEFDDVDEEASDTENIHALNGECVCGNSDEKRFWKIEAQPPSKEKLFGICCKRKSCRKEYLIGLFCEEEMRSKNQTQLLWHNIRLWLKDKGEPEYSGGCEEELGREPVEDVSSVQIGDQITWRRALGYWHHGLVVAKRNDEELDIMHWSNFGFRMKIKKDAFTKSNMRDARKVNYINIYHGAGDFWNRRLAVARANSRHHKRDIKGAVINIVMGEGEFNSDYVLLSANCEHFATYCVLGTAICYQSLRTVLCEIFRRNGKGNRSDIVAVDDGITQLKGASDSGMILLKGICLVQSFWEKRTSLNKNKIDKDEFSDDIGKQVNVFTGGGGLGAFKRAASCFSSAIQETFTSCAAMLSQVV